MAILYGKPPNKDVDEIKLSTKIEKVEYEHLCKEDPTIRESDIGTLLNILNIYKQCKGTEEKNPYIPELSLILLPFFSENTKEIIKQFCSLHLLKENEKSKNFHDIMIAFTKKIASKIFNVAKNKTKELETKESASAKKESASAKKKPHLRK